MAVELKILARILAELRGLEARFVTLQAWGADGDSQIEQEELVVVAAHAFAQCADMLEDAMTNEINKPCVVMGS